MGSPKGIQKGFVCVNTTLDQYKLFLIFQGILSNEVLDRFLFHAFSFCSIHLRFFSISYAQSFLFYSILYFSLKNQVC